MRHLFALATVCGLSACATTPAAPDFHGDYTHETNVEMVDGSDGSFTIHDGLHIGRTHNRSNGGPVGGRSGSHARLRIQLFFRNAHQCNLSGDAEVTPAGLIYRECNDDDGAPFTLAVDISGPIARLRIVEGNGSWLCGMRGSWGGTFEKTGERVEFVDD